MIKHFDDREGLPPGFDCGYFFVQNSTLSYAMSEIHIGKVEISTIMMPKETKHNAYINP